MDTLVREMKQNINKDAFIKSIFTSSDLEYHKEKTNIVGCFIGQGLQDLRLPCETFRRADTLFMGQRIVFTDSDDKHDSIFIEDYENIKNSM